MRLDTEIVWCGARKGRRGPSLAHELVGWVTWIAAIAALMGLAMLMARRRSASSQP
jgi:hypothetical protein